MDMWFALIVSGLVAQSTMHYIIIISESYGVFCKKRLDVDDHYTLYTKYADISDMCRIMCEYGIIII